MANADDCRIRLVPEGRFDISCLSKTTGATDEWVGAGTYETNGGKLVFKFVALTRRGEILREPLPEILLDFEGQGNVIPVKTENFQSRWERIWK